MSHGKPQCHPVWRTQQCWILPVGTQLKVLLCLALVVGIRVQKVLVLPPVVGKPLVWVMVLPVGMSPRVRLRPEMAGATARSGMSERRAQDNLDTVQLAHVSTHWVGVS